MHSEDIRKIINSISKLIAPSSKSSKGSSACTIESKEFDEKTVIDGWLSRVEDTSMENPRSIALLAGYHMIFGAGIYAKGLPTTDGKWFRPDTAVVRACLRTGEMILNEKRKLLRVTSRGSSVVAAALIMLAE